jgi:hypothetical protein
MSLGHPKFSSAAQIMKAIGDTVDEINYQQGKWGTEADDSKNTPWHWTAYITQYAGGWMRGSWAPIGREATDAFRKSMIKVAALAISAAASVDRQRDAAGKAFFE